MGSIEAVAKQASAFAEPVPNGVRDTAGKWRKRTQAGKVALEGFGGSISDKTTIGIDNSTRIGDGSIGPRDLDEWKWETIEHISGNRFKIPPEGLGLGPIILEDESDTDEFVIELSAMAPGIIQLRIPGKPVFMITPGQHNAVLKLNQLKQSSDVTKYAAAISFLELLSGEYSQLPPKGDPSQEISDAQLADSGLRRHSETGKLVQQRIKRPQNTSGLVHSQESIQAMVDNALIRLPVHILKDRTGERDFLVRDLLTKNVIREDAECTINLIFPGSGGIYPELGFFGRNAQIHGEASLLLDSFSLKERARYRSPPTEDELADHGFESLSQFYGYFSKLRQQEINAALALVSTFQWASEKRLVGSSEGSEGLQGFVVNSLENRIQKLLFFKNNPGLLKKKIEGGESNILASLNRAAKMLAIENWEEVKMLCMPPSLDSSEQGNMKYMADSERSIHIFQPFQAWLAELDPDLGSSQKPPVSPEDLRTDPEAENISKIIWDVDPNSDEDLEVVNTANVTADNYNHGSLADETFTRKSYRTFVAVDDEFFSVAGNNGFFKPIEDLITMFNQIIEKGEFDNHYLLHKHDETRERYGEVNILEGASLEALEGKLTRMIPLLIAIQEDASKENITEIFLATIAEVSTNQELKERIEICKLGIHEAFKNIVIADKRMFQNAEADGKPSDADLTHHLVISNHRFEEHTTAEDARFYKRFNERFYEDSPIHLIEPGYIEQTEDGLTLSYKAKDEMKPFLVHAYSPLKQGHVDQFLPVIKKLKLLQFFAQQLEQKKDFIAAAAALWRELYPDSPIFTSKDEVLTYFSIEAERVTQELKKPDHDKKVDPTGRDNSSLIVQFLNILETVKVQESKKPKKVHFAKQLVEFAEDVTKDVPNNKRKAGDEVSPPRTILRGALARDGLPSARGKADAAGLESVTHDNGYSFSDRVLTIILTVIDKGLSRNNASHISTLILEKLGLFPPEFFKLVREWHFTIPREEAGNFDFESVLRGAQVNSIEGLNQFLDELKGFSQERGITQPRQVDPQPVDPQPVDPQPVDPQPVDPQPVDPQPEEENPEHLRYSNEIQLLDEELRGIWEELKDRLTADERAKIRDRRAEIKKAKNGEEKIKQTASLISYLEEIKASRIVEVTELPSKEDGTTWQIFDGEAYAAGKEFIATVLRRESIERIEELAAIERESDLIKAIGSIYSSEIHSNDFYKNYVGVEGFYRGAADYILRNLKEKNREQFDQRIEQEEKSKKEFYQQQATRVFNMLTRGISPYDCPEDQDYSNEPKKFFAIVNPAEADFFSSTLDSVPNRYREDFIEQIKELIENFLRKKESKEGVQEKSDTLRKLDGEVRTLENSFQEQTRGKVQIETFMSAFKDTKALKAELTPFYKQIVDLLRKIPPEVVVEALVETEKGPRSNFDLGLIGELLNLAGDLRDELGDVGPSIEKSAENITEQEFQSQARALIKESRPKLKAFERNKKILDKYSPDSQEQEKFFEDYIVKSDLLKTSKSEDQEATDHFYGKYNFERVDEALSEYVSRDDIKKVRSDLQLFKELVLSKLPKINSKQTLISPSWLDDRDWLEKLFYRHLQKQGWLNFTKNLLSFELGNAGKQVFDPNLFQDDRVIEGDGPLQITKSVVGPNKRLLDSETSFSDTIELGPVGYTDKELDGFEIQHYFDLGVTYIKSQFKQGGFLEKVQEHQDLLFALKLKEQITEFDYLRICIKLGLENDTLLKFRGFASQGPKAVEFEKGKKSAIADFLKSFDESTLADAVQIESAPQELEIIERELKDLISYALVLDISRSNRKGEEQEEVNVEDIYEMLEQISQLQSRKLAQGGKLDLKSKNFLRQLEKKISLILGKGYRGIRAKFLELKQEQERLEEASKNRAARDISPLSDEDYQASQEKLNAQIKADFDRNSIKKKIPIQTLIDSYFSLHISQPDSSYLVLSQARLTHAPNELRIQMGGRPQDVGAQKFVLKKGVHVEGEDEEEEEYEYLLSRVEEDGTYVFFLSKVIKKQKQERKQEDDLVDDEYEEEVNSQDHVVHLSGDAYINWNRYGSVRLIDTFRYLKRFYKGSFQPVNVDGKQVYFTYITASVPQAPEGGQIYFICNSNHLEDDPTIVIGGKAGMIPLTQKENPGKKGIFNLALGRDRFEKGFKIKKDSLRKISRKELLEKVSDFKSYEKGEIRSDIKGERSKRHSKIYAGSGL